MGRIKDITRGITHHTIEANNWVKDGTGDGRSEFEIDLPQESNIVAQQ